jgi:hypothetical protein
MPRKSNQASEIIPQIQFKYLLNSYRNACIATVLLEEECDLLPWASQPHKRLDAAERKEQRTLNALVKFFEEYQK